MTIRNVLISTVFLAGFSSIAQANTIGVPDALGWTRGDVDSGFIEFDSFSAAFNPGGAIATLNGTSNINGGGVTGSLFQPSVITPPGGLTGGVSEPLDNRIYTHTSAFEFTLDTTSSVFDVNFVQLSVKEQAGSGIANLNVTVNGETADLINPFAAETVIAPNPITGIAQETTNYVTTFFWALDNTITAGTAFDVVIAGGAFNFDSFDSFVLDVSSVSTPVPVPAAVWLLGSALFGLITVGKRNGF